MDRPLLTAVCISALVALLFAPAGVAAAGAPADEAALSTGTGVDAPVFDRLRAAAPAPGMSRADTDGLLEQPTRSATYAAIEGSPGIDLAELVATIGVTKSTVRYHADKLEKSGLVESVEFAGALRFAPASVDTQLAAALSADPTATVLGAVAEKEPASVTEIAEATDRAPSTVSHHLSSLEEAGIVDRQRTGEAVHTTLAPDTREMMTADSTILADD